MASLAVHFSDFELLWFDGQEYVRPSGFCCPWVPLLPVLSIALNMFLFAQVSLKLILSSILSSSYHLYMSNSMRDLEVEGHPVLVLQLVALNQIPTIGSLDVPQADGSYISQLFWW
jgi:hypothetical protein